ncbi:MAG: GNAT family N-acetyltransferase [Myxococcota bacterium]|nr:GNAT family N-acetyltransferase [Myxococcota bacterium]
MSSDCRTPPGGRHAPSKGRSVPVGGANALSGIQLSSSYLHHASRHEEGGHGYASEAAGVAVRDVFERARVHESVGVTTPDNVRSRRVMGRLGIVFSPRETFEHPRVPEGYPRKKHVVYRFTVDEWQRARSG